MIHLIGQTKKKIQTDFTGRKTRIGVVGTIPAMNSNLYDFGEENNNITKIIPNAKDQQFIHDMILISTPVTIPYVNEDFVAFLRSWGKKESLDALVLGCTDLPTLLGHRDGMVELFKKEFGFQVYDPVEVLIETCAKYITLAPNIHA